MSVVRRTSLRSCSITSKAALLLPALQTTLLPQKLSIQMIESNAPPYTIYSLERMIAKDCIDASLLFILQVKWIRDNDNLKFMRLDFSRMDN